MSVEFPAGAGFDDARTSGLAALTHHLLDLGAGGLSENEIASRLADVGAQVGGSFDSDRAGVRLRTLSSERERDAALDVIGRILQQPAFSADVIEREKARVLAGIKESDTKPGTIAGRTFGRLLYRDHPYALRENGEVETVARLGREDVLRFYRGHYLSSAAVVAIVGDVTRADAERIAERLTAGLPRSQGEAPNLPPVPPLREAERATVPHPASQSHILMGSVGVARGDPDHFALFVGNHILGGGGFTSRLTEEVRQKRGLAYSVYSYFAPMLREGPFQIGLQTVGSSADQALDVIRGVLRDFIRTGPTEEELAAAKDNIVGGFPMRIDSNRDIHAYLAVIGFYRLPLTYLQDFTENVQKVTVADIRAAFGRHVDPDRMVTVVVGGGAGGGQPRP